MSSDTFPFNSGQEGLAPGQLLGRYRVERWLGAGGMGAVFEARHVDLGKRCAIKTLRGEHAHSADVKARFLREGQAASRIAHPNVVNVYDVGSEGQLTYLVMEFLEGEDMSDYLQRTGPLPEQTVADLLVPVAAALATAHQLGIVHRDVKPENVFLCKGKGAEVVPKVVDFGISKLVDVQSQALTHTSAMLGTPQYMSPEQARATKDVSYPTDQYSLGVLAYEALTGSRPFLGDTLYTLLHSIVNSEFAPPSSKVAVSPEFEAVVVRAMQNSPTERFPSMQAFGRRLLDFASDRIRITYEHEFQNELDVAAPTEKTGAAALGSAVQTEVGYPNDQTEVNASLPGDGATEVGFGAGGTEAMPELPKGPVASTLADASGVIDKPDDRGGKSKLPWAIAGAVIVAAVGGVIVAGQTDPAEEIAPEPSVAAAASAVAETPEPAAETAPAEATTSAPEAPKPSPAPKLVEVNANVVGARVFVAGEERGIVPLNVQIPPGQSELELEVRAPGYKTATHTLTQEAGDELDIQLVPIQQRPATPRPRPGQSPSPSLPKLAPR